MFFALARELARGEVLAHQGKGAPFLSPMLLCLSPILFATPLTFSWLFFLSPWGFSCQSPASFFILSCSLSRKWSVWWADWVIPGEGVWWCQISHCLAPGAKGTKEEEIEAVNEPQLHKSLGTARWDSSEHYFAVAGSYILSQFPLVKDHWPLGWQPTLQVCGYWQGRDGDNLQHISQMSHLGHQAQTLSPPFAQGLLFIHFQACGVASLPWQAWGAGWHPRGGVRQGQRGLCAVWQLTGMSTPSSFPKTSPWCCLTQCPLPARSAPVPHHMPASLLPCSWEKNWENWNEHNNYFKNFVSIFFKCL